MSLLARGLAFVGWVLQAQCLEMRDPLDPPPYQPPPRRPLPGDVLRSGPTPPPLPSEPAGIGPTLAPYVKTVASMAFSIAVYSMSQGWAFAVGFILLILVHEIGHLVAARRHGLQVSAPVFFPFIGAFIQLKEAPPNAWVEAVVGIGGPLFGTVASVVPYLLHVRTGAPFWGELAYYGFLLNLFNLAPVGTLDGGRIVTAISTWLWVPGYGVFLGLLLLRWYQAPDLARFLDGNLLLVAMLALGLPRLVSLFRPRTAREEAYYRLEPSQRFGMGAMYFGLIFLLYLAIRSVRGG